MESQNIWPPILVLILAIGALFGYYHLERVDEARNALESARMGRENSQKYLNSRRAMWGELEQKVVLAHRIQANETLLAERETRLENIRREVEADLNYLSDSMGSAKQQLMAESGAQSVPVFQLKDGRSFNNAKITRADGSGISVVHSDGISKIEMTNLPDELVEKFDLGPNSIQHGIENLQQIVGLAPDEDRSKLEAQERAYARRIEQLEAAVERARSFKVRLEEEVLRFDEQIEEARSEGQLTITLRSSRDVADGKAGDARRELVELENELLRLRAAAAELKTKK